MGLKVVLDVSFSRRMEVSASTEKAMSSIFDRQFIRLPPVMPKVFGHVKRQPQKQVLCRRDDDCVGPTGRICRLSATQEGDDCSWVTAFRGVQHYLRGMKYQFTVSWGTYSSIRS